MVLPAGRGTSDKAEITTPSQGPQASGKAHVKKSLPWHGVGGTAQVRQSLPEHGVGGKAEVRSSLPEQGASSWLGLQEPTWQGLGPRRRPHGPPHSVSPAVSTDHPDHPRYGSSH